MRYIILDYDYGIFLGTHTNKGFVDNPRGAVALWSSENYFSLTRAFSFSTKTEAHLFIESFLHDFPGAFVTGVHTDEQYIDVVDLIKAGLHNFTFDMIDGIHMPNETIH